MKKTARKGKKPRKLNANGKQDTRPIIWTIPYVQSELAGMMKEVKKDKTILFIGELFEERKYSRQRFSEWALKFEQDPEISDTIRRIEAILEARVAKGALKGTYNANFAKFHMINNHNWKEKTTIDPDPAGGPSSLSRVLEEADKRRRDRDAK